MNCYNYIANTIDAGLKNDNFSLSFQPQYDLRKDRCFGFEALTRLKDRRGKLIPPSKFIPVAEYTDQIFELEQWVFRAGLEFKKILEKQGYGEHFLSINLSARSLIHDTYFYKLVEIIDSYNINYENLIIEITETEIITNLPKACHNLEVFKDKGIYIALDDFGTSFSSLSHLDVLPIDIIKLDRSMISKVPHNKKTSTIIKRVLELSHELGCIVVAEGIENDLQLEFLRKIECDIVQGYLYAKPMPSEYLLELIEILPFKRKRI